MWFVYILLCKDGSLYTGISNNLAKRLTDHKNGKGGRYTRSHKAVRIVYSESLTGQSDALKKEMYIKGMPREKKIRIFGLKLS